MKQLAVIERASPADYGAITAIYNESILSGGSNMEEEPKREEDIAQWVVNFHEREALFVMRRAGEVIGWSIIKRYSDRPGYRYACETAVYLRASEVGKGYGSQMKRHLIEVCREMNYHHLVAKIFATNERSIRYNEKLGYTIVGRQKEIGFKNGQWQDMVIMQYLMP